MPFCSHEQVSLSEDEDDETELDNVFTNATHPWKTPHGSEKEVNSLKQELLHHAELLFPSAPLHIINFHTAKEFSTSKPRWKSLDFHLNSVNCPPINWVRKDQRVSFEILKVTFNFNNNSIFVTKNSNQKDRQKKNTTEEKLQLPFQHVAGIKINHTTHTVAAHIYHPPRLAKRTDGAWNVVEQDAVVGSISSLSLHLVDDKYDLSELQSCFAQNQFLSKAARIGLLLDKSYPEFADTSPAAYERFPVLKDPTLVREAQLAHLQLLEAARTQNKDVKWLVKIYHGLNIRFRSLLSSRGQSSPLSPEE